MMGVMLLRAGLTQGVTDASAVLYGIRRLVPKDRRACDRTDVRDFIGAWSRSPITVLSARPAGACHPRISLEEDSHAHHEGPSHGSHRRR